MLRSLSFLSLLLLASLVSAAEFSVVPAEPQRIREGIGNALEKLNAGKTVNVAYLGGSITAANGWRPKTTAWLKKTYPGAAIYEINAAIGGTGSDLGVFRLQHDVLQHHPDLLFVEFAVNDGGAAPESIWRSMEGIVRQTWKANPKTDIVFVYTIAGNMVEELAKGNCFRSMSAMELLADFYGIPSINFGVPVVALEKEGKLIFKGKKDDDLQGKILFSEDSVHPLDAGHEIYAEAVVKAFDAMKPSKPLDHAPKLAKVFVEDNWEAAKMVPITDAMLSGDWKKLGPDDNLQKSFGNRIGEIWTSGKPGSKLTFQFKGKLARIYDLLGPDGGQVVVTVDGKTNSKPTPRFDSYCTYYRLATLGLADGLDLNTVHTICVEIHSEQPDRKSISFRLKDPEKELAEPKYQGTNVWFGKLMILGDLVP